MSMRRKVQTCRAAAPIRADRMQVAACRDFEPVKVKNAGTVVPIECTLLSLLHCVIHTSGDDMPDETQTDCIHVHCEPNKTMTFLRHNEPELTPGHSTAVRRCNTQMGYKQQQRVTVAQSGGGPRPATTAAAWVVGVTATRQRQLGIASTLMPESCRLRAMVIASARSCTSTVSAFLMIFLARELASGPNGVCAALRIRMCSCAIDSPRKAVRLCSSSKRSAPSAHTSTGGPR